MAEDEDASNEPKHSTSAVGEAEQGEEGAACGSSWLNMNSWLSYAKETSVNAYASTKSQSAHVWGFVKRDLGEFAETIKADSKAVYEQISSGNEENSGTITTGISNIVNSVTNAMYIPPDDSDQQALLVTQDGEICPHDWEQSRILALRSDPATFQTDPQGQPDEFLAFLESFSDDSEQKEISELLMGSSELRALYSQLVPSELSHRHFWARYYFRVQQIQAKGRQRQELKRRAEQRVLVAASDSPEDAINWDEDETAGDDLRLCDRGDTVVVKHAASADSSASGATPNADVPDVADADVSEAPAAAQKAALTDDWCDDPDVDVDDVELTEEEIRKAKELATSGKFAEVEGEEEDDWSKWE